MLGFRNFLWKIHVLFQISKIAYTTPKGDQWLSLRTTNLFTILFSHVSTIKLLGAFILIELKKKD